MRLSKSFFIVLTLLSLCSLSLAGCTDSNTSSTAITIQSGSTSIGSDGENNEQQTITFQWQIKNNDPEEVLLQWIQPNPSEELAGRLLTEDLRINVGKVIGPEETIEVEGELTFDAAGLTKNEIIEKCFITDMTVSTESTVNINMVFRSSSQDILK